MDFLRCSTSLNASSTLTPPRYALKPSGVCPPTPYEVVKMIFEVGGLPALPATMMHLAPRRTTEAAGATGVLGSEL